MRLKQKQIFLLFILAAFFGCADKESTQTQQVSLEQIPQAQRTQLSTTSEELVGEFYILAETELNPAVIESSINEIITSRAPYVNSNKLSVRRDDGNDDDSEDIYERAFKDTENELESDPYFSDLLTEYISQEDIENLNRAEKRIRAGQKILRKYSSIVVDLTKNFGQCWGSSKMSVLQCQKLQVALPSLDISCNVQFSGCEIDGYSVYGNAYVVLNGSIGLFPNFSYSITFSNLNFKKNNEKYVNIVSGTISGSVTSSVGSAIWNQSVNGIKIEDTEDKVILEGSISQNSSYQKDDVSRVRINLQDLKVTNTADNTSYTADGFWELEDRNKGVFSTSVDLSIEENGKITSLKVSNRREKSKNPKVISRELSIDVNFSSPTTSFSVSGYRYKSVKHTMSDSKTFSLSITSYLKVNDSVVRSYNHNLTAVKGDGAINISGTIEIIKDEGEKIIIELLNVVFQRGCNRPVGGTIYGQRIKNGETTDVEIVFNEGCVCDVGVKANVDDKVVVFNADICLAGEKMKDKIKEQVKRKGYGMMSGGGSSDNGHHHGMH